METTHTTKVVVAVCAIIAVLAFIGGYYFRNAKSDDVTVSPTPSVSETGTPTATVAYVPHTYTVKRTSAGLTPATLDIRVGDTVTLVNNTDMLFWPASDPHPTHTNCPGFDALRGLKNGESYTLTFTKVQTCGYHNHLDPALRGTITVR